MNIVMTIRRAKVIIEDSIQNCVAHAIEEGWITCEEDINENQDIEFYEVADTPLKVSVKMNIEYIVN